jgi:hypothetical protein
MVFQRDGAFPYFSQVMGFLNQNIDHPGSETWPPRYSDLTPLDFLIWGHDRYFLQDEYTGESGTLCVGLWMLLLTC